MWPFLQKTNVAKFCGFAIEIKMLTQHKQSKCFHLVCELPLGLDPELAPFLHTYPPKFLI